MCSPLYRYTTASLYRSHQPLPLAIAIQQGNVKTVKTLLESGASKDLTQLVQRQGSDPERRDRDWIGVSAGVHCLATALQKLQRHLTDAMAARPSHPSWEAAEKAGSTGVMAPAALIGVGEGRLLPSGKYSGEETKETKDTHSSHDGGQCGGSGAETSPFVVVPEHVSGHAYVTARREMATLRLEVFAFACIVSWYYPLLSVSRLSMHPFQFTSFTPFRFFLSFSCSSIRILVDSGTSRA